ncbi:MAG: flavodoxin-dependent (E)-4-hydroxy-3-methylbut-2-enyl-diphosphate synthase [Planctomycetota bacterium]|nr:flavodoxin-dependent (E)-4-hydroxy-3-methylbut-2-enyl-diphosphate synthase [Planctomycetota bacterium]MDI6786839.1 flavodoxin-dependent (E)-4-hydroxy-3-methylbut-2-enyl-diphosphate synthase [Planctomycetota bacterium]
MCRAKIEINPAPCIEGTRSSDREGVLTQPLSAEYKRAGLTRGWINRRRTKAVWLGKVKIGDGAPISVQSMTKTVATDIKATIKQIKELEALGCEIIRVAIPNHKSALALSQIKREIKIPIEADIHFNPELALESIKQGVDGIRLNPGNITDKEAIIEIVKLAHRKHIPIRVGLNSGSVNGWLRSNLRHQLFPRKPVPLSMSHPPLRPDGYRGGIAKDGSGMTKDGKSLAQASLEYVNFLESLKFNDIMISLKSSDVISTIYAYRYVAGLCEYPLHLGVTASGTLDDATIKSSIGIGSLLLEGIGDTIRVSITGPPHDEVRIGYKILQSLGLRRQKVEIISCPTCGRCEIDIIKIVQKLRGILEKESLSPKGNSIKVAVMGCVVNGPGEAMECDIGIAGGKDFGFLFKNGERIRKIPESKIVTELVKEIRALSL